MKPSEANAIFPLDEAPPVDRSSDDDAPEVHDLPSEDVVRRIMKDVMVRRARGELLSDERVLAEHPAHLHPQIKEELNGLRMIHRVLQAARKAGPLDDNIAPLDTEQLEAPIGGEQSSGIHSARSADRRRAPGPPHPVGRSHPPTPCRGIPDPL